MLIPQNIIDNLSNAQQQTTANSQVATQQVNPIVQEQPKFDTKSAYAGLFEQQKEKQSPTYNTRFEKQQKALMTAQTVGNALALVGDVAGAAKGAPIKRRQFKSTEPYLQAIENKRQQYEKDNQAFNHEKYIEQLRLLGYISQADAAEAQAKQNKIANERADKELDLQKQGLDLRKTAQEADIANRKDVNKYNQDRLTQDQKQFEATQKFNREKLTAENTTEMLKTIQKDEKGHLKLFTDKGEKVASLDDSMVNKAFALIQEDYGDSPELQKDITLLKAQFGEGLSKDARAFLVTKHWNNSEKAKKFLQLGKPETADFTASNAAGTAQSKTNVDYGKYGKYAR